MYLERTGSRAPLSAASSRSISAPHLLAKAVAQLPRPGSALWRQHVEQLRTALNPKTGPGFLILDTSSILTQSVGSAIYDHFRPPAAKFAPETVFMRLPPQLEKLANTRPGLPNRVALTVTERGSLDALAGWSEALLNAALSQRKPPAMSMSELRLESAAEPASFRQWHTDGDNFTTLTPLYGPGPWATLDRSMAGRKAQPNDQAIKVLRGQTLYLSGNRRSEIEATTHTTPPIDANRALLVTRHVG